MIKNIQNKLLTSFPLIWNIKLVPMVLIVIAINLLFYFLGYITTDVSFDNENYYYAFSGPMPFLYFSSVLVSILALIGWLVIYNRYNAFKSYYPKSSLSLFSEWFITLLICLGLSISPFLLSYGNLKKVQSVSTLEQISEAKRLMSKVRILIPDDIDEYIFENSDLSPISLAHNTIPDSIQKWYKANSVDLKNGQQIDGYTGPSLLYYDAYLYNQYDNGYEYDPYVKNQSDNEYDFLYAPYYKDRKIYKQRAADIKQVKSWLMNGQTDSIRNLMEQYINLEKKYGIKDDLTVDQWFNKIYNPPYFPIQPNTFIRKSVSYSLYDYYKSSYDYETDDTVWLNLMGDTVGRGSEFDPSTLPETIVPYLSYEIMQSGFDRTYRSYNTNNDIWYILLSGLCTGLIISFFIFSFRVTNGRYWLIAIISTGIIIFISGLMAVGLSMIGDIEEEMVSMFFLLFWIILFLTSFIYILFKIKDGKKNHSATIINVMLWIMPFVIPFITLFFFVLEEFRDSDFFDNKGEWMICVLWANIPAMIIAMLAITPLLRRWKSLPEE